MGVIAIDLGGTKLATALFTTAGKPVIKAVHPLEGSTGGAVGLLIREAVRKLGTIARQKGIKIHSAGVSVPGICHSESGTVWVPNIAGWEKYPLREAIQSGLSNRRAKIIMDSDRSCYIRGEAWLGVARGCSNAVFLAVGTGIGAGVMVDGKILRGARNIAGSIGWMALNRPFRPEYKSCGCLEYHASGAGLTKVAREMLRLQRKEPGSSGRAEITTKDIFSGSRRGNPLARSVIQQAIEFWGMATANLVSIFDPEMIVFGGGVFGPAAEHLDDIEKAARKWAQPISMKHVKLRVSALKGEAGLYGAARLAFDSMGC